MAGPCPGAGGGRRLRADRGRRPGENPAGVVPRPGEVVELVAAEFLRGQDRGARRLAREIVGVPARQTLALPT
ncbi:hypothetical protein NKH18_50475 [Streptomyces sp. M10(2022)]